MNPTRSILSPGQSPGQSRGQSPGRVMSDPIRRTVRHQLFVCAVLAVLAGTLRAQDQPPAKDSAASGAPEAGQLNEAEASLSRRYKQFERTLLQMAEYLRKTEPERAELLVRAIGKSKEDRVNLQMDQIIDLLKSDQLGDAIGREQHLVSNLKGLLELLQSEDRRHQLEEEKKWLESVQQEIGKLSVREKELRRATEKGARLGPLADRQGKIGGETKSLLEKIDQQDSARNASNKKNAADKAARSADGEGRKEGANKENPDKQTSNKQGPEKQSADKQKPDKQNPDKEKTDKQKPGGPSDSKKEGKNSQASKAKPGNPSQKSKPGDRNQQPPQQSENSSPENSPQEPSENQSPSEPTEKKTPGREQLEQARRAMQQAEEELRRLEGNKALERQDEAIRKLADAKARLEKILRQLREEEQEIMLTSLEARFAKMLLMQIQLHLDTVTLSKTGKNAWTPRHFGKARDLSVAETAISEEALRALTLLKEEGSSVAFPKGVEQVRDDMLTIAQRLGKNDVGELTQSIEKDVIESLEELVAALQSEIENRKKPENQRRQRQRQGGEPGEKELVEKIAELKMLRSLQLRVNRRTKQLGRLIPGEQATSDDVAAQLQSLARRQAEIQEATYILASGRNQ